MEINDKPWVYVAPDGNDWWDEIEASEYDMGKWMLFYKNDILNDKWCKVVSLFQQNKLKGIISMKCSTAYKNHRATSEDEGVIILYALNSPDVIETGQNILTYLGTDDIESSHIYYKTDFQTFEGTRATGSKRNHTHKIRVRPLPHYNIYSFIEDPDEQ